MQLRLIMNLTLPSQLILQAFMERLGLWGEGAPFSNFESFLETVHKRGLGVAEMLAMEMKASGIYVTRGLSYKNAEVSYYYFEIRIHNLLIFSKSAAEF